MSKPAVTLSLNV